MQKVAALAIAALGVGFAALAVIIAIDRVPLIVSGVTATGTVISVNPDVRVARQTGILVFRDRAGLAHRAGTTSGGKHIGDTVAIRYLPDDPNHSAEDSFATLWVAMIVLPLLALFFVKAGYAIATKS